LFVLLHQFKAKILEQNISRLYGAGSTLHYPAQLVLTNARFLGNPVPGLATGLDMLSNGLNNHSNNHISKSLHVQYKLLLGSYQVQYRKNLNFS
jgi:hypothetical protein